MQLFFRLATRWLAIMRLLVVSSGLLAFMPLFGESEIPSIAPTSQIADESLLLLKPAEAASVHAGWRLRVSLDYTVFSASDDRNPDKAKPLATILKVDQAGFARTINDHSLPSSPQLPLEKIECSFWESREENGDSVPYFRIKWTFRRLNSGQPETLEAFSPGVKYSEWTVGLEKRKALLARGAAAAYQAATYKLAIALQKSLADAPR